MAQVITLTGERLFALKAQNNQQLDIDTFIFAYVPGQDSTAPIDRNEGLPPVNQRVHQQIVQQYGMLNDNAVVYSSVLDSLTGPFQFNWVGLYSAVNQTLVAIQHIPTVVKTVTEPGASGNILNRNFVIEYSGIAELTGITVDPATWQYDFNARLNGMDELTRQLAADMNGKDWFIGDGFKVVPRSTLNTFKVTAGAGYVSGLRVELAADHILTLSSYPQFVYVDAWFDGTSESVWKGHTAFTVTNTEMDDYIDVNGRKHYIFKLSRITAADVVEDLRNVDGIAQKITKLEARTPIAFATKAEATAALGELLEQQLVRVNHDESLAQPHTGRRAMYLVSSAALMFKNIEPTGEDYYTPNGAKLIRADDGRQLQEHLDDIVSGAATEEQINDKIAYHDMDAQAHAPLSAFITAEGDRAELAAEIAAAAGNVWQTKEAGGANTPVNGYFSVPVAGSPDSLIVYRVDVGHVAVEVTRYASSDAVKKPVRTGKINGWPDPFFRHIQIDEDFLGKSRWKGNTNKSLTMVDNTVFHGKALRKTTADNTDLAGPKIYLSDIGAVAGDTVTVKALIQSAANSPIVTMYTRLYDISNGYTSGQFEVTKTVAAGTGAILFEQEIVIPANTDHIWVYPTNSVASAMFDVVALWVSKGTAATSPTWPTFEDESYLLQKDSFNTIAIANNSAQLAGIVVPVQNIVADTTSLTLPVTEVSPSSVYGLPFTGWAERYTPAGVSFNAICVKSVGRSLVGLVDTARWATLNVVIRTGVNSHMAGATIVAVGSIKVPSTLDLLKDTIILLKDPKTGAAKTLSDTSFTDGEYCICVYARNAKGAGAAMSPHRATQVNSKLVSYYLTSENPLTGTYSNWSSNLRLGVEHLLLTGAVETTVYQPTPSFIDKINKEDEAANTTIPTPILPPTIYGLQGREVNMYFDNCLMMSASTYDWDITGVALGVQQEERWTWEATAAYAASNITVSAIDKQSGKILASSACTIQAVSDNAGAGMTQRCIFIGDSLTANGIYVTELNTIAATDVMKIELLGTKGSGDNKHEGISGWTVDLFTKAGSPFWDGDQVNFGWYLSTNSMPAPDWVCIMLGINDVFGQVDDASCINFAATEFKKLDTLIASVKAANANTRIALMTPTPPSSSQDAFGANYTVNQNRARFKRNIMLWNRELIARYKGRTAEKLYVCPTHVNLDTVNNMSRGALATVNSRSTVTVKRQNNGVHPATEGYYQIADSVWAFLKNMA